MEKKLGLKAHFGFVIGILLLGFTVFGAVSVVMLQRLQVNGPLYANVVRGKDLIADILPPPAYLIESSLTVHELFLEPDAKGRASLVAKLERLERDFDDRTRFWNQQPLPADIAHIMSGELARSGHEFFALARDEFLPALQSGEREQSSIALSHMKVAYNAHRAAVDRVVVLANQQNSAVETEAQQLIRAGRLSLLFIFIGSMVAALLATIWVARRLFVQIGGEPAYAQHVVSELAQGKLNTPITLSNGSSSLLHGIDAMTRQMTDVIQGIDDTNREIGQSIYQVVSISRDIAKTGQQQHEESTRVSAATENLRGVMSEVLNLATSARARTESVDQLAKSDQYAIEEIIAHMRHAVAQVTDSESTVRALADASGEINSIVLNIKTIADQTNLLALNAAIEAARAGEQGRGFAVVADEVRTLATRTSGATQQIETIVGSLNARIADALGRMVNVTSVVEQARTSAEQAGESIRQIAEEAQESSHFSQEIVQASTSQLEQLRDLQIRLGCLFDALRSSEVTLSVTHSISTALQQSVGALQQKVDFFRFTPQPRQQERHNEKRRHERAHNSLFVTIAQGTSKVPALARNFSSGGLLLAAPTQLRIAKGDVLALEIKLPESELTSYLQQAPIAVRGGVVRVERGADKQLLGIEFQEVTPELARQLSSALSYYQAAV